MAALVARARQSAPSLRRSAATARVRAPIEAYEAAAKGFAANDQADALAGCILAAEADGGLASICWPG